MQNQNDLPPHTRQPAPPHEQALAAWLDGAMQPSAIAIIWRLWLPHTRAAALLAELHDTGAAVSTMGLIGESGVRSTSGSAPSYQGSRSSC